jgi:hypothetical protein
MLSPPEPIASASEPVQPVLGEEGGPQSSSLREQPQAAQPRRTEQLGLHSRGPGRKDSSWKLSPAMGPHGKQSVLRMPLLLLLTCVQSGTGLGE